MTTKNPERHLQAFVDALHAEAADADPLGMLPVLYAALRSQVSFSSTAFLQFDPPDWTVAACYVHDIGLDMLPSLTELYRGMAAARIRMPGLRHLNEVLDMAECLDPERVRRGEFGEALRRLADGGASRWCCSCGGSRWGRSAFTDPARCRSSTGRKG